MGTTDILQLQQHAWGIARISVVISGLEGKSAGGGDKITRHGQWLVIQGHRQHGQLPATMGFTGHFLKKTSAARPTAYRRVFLAFPALELQRDKGIEPRLQV